MTNRTGLYVMVAIGMIGSCIASYETGKIRNSLEGIDSRVSRVERIKKSMANLQRRLGITEANVIGEERADLFYEAEGKRVYLEIDGSDPEEYFKKHTEERR